MYVVRAKGISDLSEWALLILLQISFGTEVERNDCRWLCVSNGDSHLLTVNCFVLVVALCGKAIWREWCICSLHCILLDFVLVDWTDERPFCTSLSCLASWCLTALRQAAGDTGVSVKRCSDTSWGIKRSMWHVDHCWSGYSLPTATSNYTGTVRLLIYIAKRI